VVTVQAQPSRNFGPPGSLVRSGQSRRRGSGIGPGGVDGGGDVGQVVFLQFQGRRGQPAVDLPGSAGTRPPPIPMSITSRDADSARFTRRLVCVMTVTHG